MENDLENEFEKALRQHDWWYQMSDDSRYFYSGEAQRRNIGRLIVQIAPEKARELWAKHAPPDFKCPV